MPQWSYVVCEPLKLCQLWPPVLWMLWDKSNRRQPRAEHWLPELWPWVLFAATGCHKQDKERVQMYILSPRVFCDMILGGTVIIVPVKETAAIRYIRIRWGLGKNRKEDPCCSFRVMLWSEIQIDYFPGSWTMPLTFTYINKWNATP